jgi:2-keto-4-pentenoate hydratase/2-oxohepta-3-ene-1,7-dioic acid hydratase in catechol pathway
VRLASFIIDGEPVYGLIADDRVMPATTEFRSTFPDLRAVLAAGAERRLPDNVGAALPAGTDLQFQPPLPAPGKILCVGVNFRAHIAEMGRSVPDYPVVFTRFASSLVGHRAPLVRPAASLQYDFEGELAVIIGKAARHVSRQNALEHVAGYTCFMDGSVRDWQRHTGQFTPGKNFERSGAMGPWLVTADEIPNPASLRLETRVNGTSMQRGELADLVFDIPALLEYCSTFTELLPGDVIATGTPGGVGAARTPPTWLQPGDIVEVEIEPIGVLESLVSDEVTASHA